MMRLQVAVEPPKGEPALSATSKQTFLQLIEPRVTLDELKTAIEEQYRNLYPRSPALDIYKLQDAQGNDLDLSYRVEDVFSDKFVDKENSIVRVWRTVQGREASLPPESGLRQRKKRTRKKSPDLSTVAEESTLAPESRPPPVKRRRKEYMPNNYSVVEDSSEERETRNTRDSEEQMIPDMPTDESEGEETSGDDEGTGVVDNDDDGDDDAGSIASLPAVSRQNGALPRRSPLLGRNDSSFPSADDDSDENEDENSSNEDANGDSEGGEEAEIQVPSTAVDVDEPGGTSASHDSISDTSPSPPSPSRKRNRESASKSRNSTDGDSSEELSSPEPPRKVLESVQIIRPTTITYQSNRLPSARQTRSSKRVSEQKVQQSADKPSEIDPFALVVSEDEASHIVKTKAPGAITKPTGRKSMLAPFGLNPSAATLSSFQMQTGVPTRASMDNENTRDGSVRQASAQLKKPQLRRAKLGVMEDTYNVDKRQNEGSESDGDETPTKTVSRNFKARREQKKTGKRNIKSEVHPKGSEKEIGKRTSLSQHQKLKNEVKGTLSSDDAVSDESSGSDSSSEEASVKGENSESSEESSDGETKQKQNARKRKGKAKESNATNGKELPPRVESVRAKRNPIVPPVPPIPGTMEKGKNKSVSFAPEPTVQKPIAKPTPTNTASKGKNPIIPPPVPLEFVGSSDKITARNRGKKRGTGSRTSSAPNISSPQPTSLKKPKAQDELQKKNSPSAAMPEEVTGEQSDDSKFRPSTTKKKKKVVSDQDADIVAHDNGNKPAALDTTISRIKTSSSPKELGVEVEEVQILEDTEMEDVGADVEDNVEPDLNKQDIEEITSPLFARKSQNIQQGDNLLPDTDAKDDGDDEGERSKPTQITSPNLPITIKPNVTGSSDTSGSSPVSFGSSQSASPARSPVSEQEASDKEVKEESASASSDPSSSGSESSSGESQNGVGLRRSKSVPSSGSSSESASDLSSESSSGEEAETVPLKRTKTNKQEPKPNPAEALARRSKSPEKSRAPKVPHSRLSPSNARQSDDDETSSDDEAPSNLNTSKNYKGQDSPKKSRSPSTSGSDASISNAGASEEAAAKALFSSRKAESHSSPARNTRRRSETPLCGVNALQKGTPTVRTGMGPPSSQPVRSRARSKTPNDVLHSSSQRRVKKLSPAKLSELANSAPPSSQTKAPSSQQGAWVSLSQLMQSDIPETRESNGASSQRSRNEDNKKTPLSNVNTFLPAVSESENGSDTETSDSGNSSGDSNDEDETGATLSSIPPERMATQNTPGLAQRSRGLTSLLGLFRSSQGN